MPAEASGLACGLFREERTRSHSHSMSPLLSPDTRAMSPTGYEHGNTDASPLPTSLRSLRSTIPDSGRANYYAVLSSDKQVAHAGTDGSSDSNARNQDKTDRLADRVGVAMVGHNSLASPSSYEEVFLYILYNIIYICELESALSHTAHSDHTNVDHRI